MSRHPARAAALLLGCLLLPALTAASCEDPPSGVAVGAAARGTVGEIVEAPGSVTARAAATVSSPAEGTLGRLHVGPGDRVRKGDLIAEIDSPATTRRLADARELLDRSRTGGVPRGGTGAYDAARRRTDQQAATAFRTAREAAATITDPAVRTALLTQTDAAERQYESASATAGAAVRSLQNGVTGLARAVDSLGAAQRLQAKQAYDLAKAAVDALILRAPVAGTVQLGGVASGGTASLSDLLAAGARQPAAAPAPTLPGVDVAVPEGAVVAAGTPIVTVVDTARLGLVAEVDETDVLLVTDGVRADVELDAAAGAGYRATVRAVDLLPTTSARGGVSYRVRLDLGRGTYADGTAAPAPRPGMSAVVRLRVREARDAVTVPASAVVSADGRDTVWAVRDGRAERVPVTLGVQGEDVVQVVSGIGDGQRIVVGGADRVRSGDEVP